MRIDVTVCRPGLDEVDIALLAETGTALRALRSDLERVTGLSATVPLAANGVGLPVDAVLGDDVPAGARLAPRGEDEPIEPPALLELHVVCGPDAGAVRPLRSGRVLVGRGAVCDVALSDPDVSRRHALLSVTSTGVHVTDLGSTNGSCVDGHPVPASGTTVSPGAYLQVGDTVLAVRPAGSGVPRARRYDDGSVVVDRTARVPSPEVAATVELPAPPERSRRSGQLLPIALPLIAGAVLALVLHSIQFLLFTLLSPMVALGTIIGDRHGRRNRRRQRRDYGRALASGQDAAAAAIRSELSARRNAAPDPAALAATTGAIGPELWSRRADDPDALRVRIGLQNRPSATQVRVGRAEPEPAAVLPLVPAECDLRDGSLGIVGPRGVALAIGRWIVAQLASQLPPDELRIVPALGASAEADWHWLRWLPHLRPGPEPVPAGTPGWTIVVVDGTCPPDHGEPERAASDPAARIRVVCIGDRADGLPARCATVVEPTGTAGTRLRTHGRSRADGVLADQVDARWADRVARHLAPLVSAGSGLAAIPRECRLVQLLAPPALDPDAIVAGWQDTDRSVRTLLGVGTSGPVDVDLARDGPHALVAGTTGSGKSELLQTLVAGLALQHPPDELSFVLIDYKGGAAFSECADLPHVCGLVTDLDTGTTARALQSLESEVRRREQLLADVGVRDLESYRARPTVDPLARLVLVVDEFATLADDLPNFVAGLIDVARRGRSLGIHLVLATQRPSGVVAPEIRANTTLRIALRMNDPGESIDVVGTPAAAQLHTAVPGRAIVRTASGLVQLQTARVGGAATARTGYGVEPLTAWRSIGQRPDTDSATDLSVIVASVQAAAQLAGRRAPPPPWLAPLPEVLPADAVQSEHAAEVAFGLVDLPKAQRQEPALLDLADGGSVIVAGAPGSGRTSTLATIALRAATSFSPDRLGIYLLGAGPDLDAVRSLPHCATAAGTDDIETVATLAVRLLEDVSRRRHRIRRPGSSDVAPVALVLVDGWETLTAAADAFDGGRTTDALLALMRTAPSSGVTMLAAGDRAVLTPRLTATATEVYVLRLADRADYGLLGLRSGAIPATMPPGRAVRRDGALLQIAAPADPPQGNTHSAAEAGPSQRAPAGPFIRLRRLPDRVSLDELGADRRRIVLGVGGDAADAIYLDPLAGTARLLVAGPPRSGRSTVLHVLAEQAACSGMRVLLAAPARSPLRQLAGASGVTLLDPDLEPDISIETPTLVVVDDSEAFTDTILGDALTAVARRFPARLGIAVAASRDELPLTFRGLATEVRRARNGLLLDPQPIDGELLGVRLPRGRVSGRAGRAVLVADPAMCPQLNGQPTSVQIALPASSADPMCGYR